MGPSALSFLWSVIDEQRFLVSSSAVWSANADTVCRDAGNRAKPPKTRPMPNFATALRESAGPANDAGNLPARRLSFFFRAFPGNAVRNRTALQIFSKLGPKPIRWIQTTLEFQPARKGKVLATAASRLSSFSDWFYWGPESRMRRGRRTLCPRTLFPSPPFKLSVERRHPRMVDVGIKIPLHHPPC